MIDVSKLDKAEVLAALYNAAKSIGMGRLQYDPKPMTVEEARALLASRVEAYGEDPGGPYFDYLKGRVMKVRLADNFIDPYLYDRDNGLGAAEAALLDLLTRPERAP